MGLSFLLCDQACHVREPLANGHHLLQEPYRNPYEGCHLGLVDNNNRNKQAGQYRIGYPTAS